MQLNNVTLGIAEWRDLIRRVEIGEVREPLVNIDEKVCSHTSPPGQIRTGEYTRSDVRPKRSRFGSCLTSADSMTRSDHSSQRKLTIIPHVSACTQVLEPVLYPRARGLTYVFASPITVGQTRAAFQQE